MKRYLLIAGILFVFSFMALYRAGVAQDTDYDRAFDTAAKMRGHEGVFGTDELVKNTTQVLHQENMKILAEIEKLHEEIADLKKRIEDVKDIVEGGQ